MTWIAESGPIPSHMVIARADLDPDMSGRFTIAMLRLNEPANRELLKYLYGPEGYEPTDPRALEPVRAIARRYGLLK